MTYGIAKEMLASKKRAYKRQFDNYQDTGYTKYYNAYSNYERQIEALEGWIRLHDMEKRIDKMLSSRRLTGDQFKEIKGGIYT